MNLAAARLSTHHFKWRPLLLGVDQTEAVRGRKDTEVLCA